MQRGRLAGLVLLLAAVACTTAAKLDAPVVSSSPPTPPDAQLLCASTPASEVHGRADAFSVARPGASPLTAPERLACVRLDAPPAVNTRAAGARADCSLDILDVLCNASDAACVRVTADGAPAVRARDTSCLRSTCLVRLPRSCPAMLLCRAR
jgi:hypothetical protein